MAILPLESDQALTPLETVLLPPCPLIGIGTHDHPLAPWCDTVVDNEAAAQPIIANIEANPKAAAVLVQLLRHIEGMADQGALLAESLTYGLLQGSAEHLTWRTVRQLVPATAPGTLSMQRNGDCLAILIDRPAAHNAIDQPMRDALREAFELAALDHSIQHVALRGAGRAFCVGADMSEFGTTLDPATAHAIRIATLPAHAIARCSERLHVHVQGACVGSGLEMAAFASRITASPSAWFQLPELAMGLIPGAGGCVSVMRRIGRRRAAQLILSGRRISATTALNWGLIDAIIDD